MRNCSNEKFKSLKSFSSVEAEWVRHVLVWIFNESRSLCAAKKSDDGNLSVVETSNKVWCFELKLGIEVWRWKLLLELFSDIKNVCNSEKKYGETQNKIS